MFRVPAALGSSGGAQWRGKPTLPRRKVVDLLNEGIRIRYVLIAPIARQYCCGSAVCGAI
jgi:hypothetical protein